MCVQCQAMTQALITAAGVLGTVAMILLFVRNVLLNMANSHENALQALVQAITMLHETVASTTASTAQAVGVAVQTALAPAPSATLQADHAADLAHELASKMAPVDTVDDSDPTDAYIAGDRPMAAPLDRESSAPFGIPGLKAEAPVQGWPVGQMVSKGFKL